MANIGISRNVLVEFDTATGKLTGVLKVDGNRYTVSLANLDTAITPAFGTAAGPSSGKIFVAVNTINSVALTGILNSTIYPGDVPGDNTQYIFQTPSNTTFQVSTPTSSVGAVF